MSKPRTHLLLGLISITVALCVSSSSVSSSVAAVDDRDVTRNSSCSDKEGSCAAAGTNWLGPDDEEEDEEELRKLFSGDITDWDYVDGEDDSCVDKHDKCEFWFGAGECEKNPRYMYQYCPRSCNVCFDSSDLGEPQTASGEEAEQTLEVIRAAKDYFEKEVMVKDEYVVVRSDCKNRHELCSFWAAVGECTSNPTYMQTYCALACRSCLKLDIEQRCPLDPNAKDALYPGDLNNIFLSIINNPEYAQYNPTVLSRPAETEHSLSEEERDYQLGPWVITLDDFLTHQECDTLIQHGHRLGYQRSEDVGERRFDGTYDSDQNDGRTSTNAWCEGECTADPLVTAVYNRIQHVTQIPTPNYESFQLLKYEPGQFYQSHHDYIPHQVRRQCGPRILTFYLYLNDVQKGGGTRFTDLDLTVMPKRGRALIWPSVLDSDPNQSDVHTHHEAMPVQEGIKYGANVWIHMRDFQTPSKNGC